MSVAVQVWTLRAVRVPSKVLIRLVLVQHTCFNHVVQTMLKPFHLDLLGDLNQCVFDQLLVFDAKDLSHFGSQRFSGGCVLPIFVVGQGRCAH